MNSILLRLPAVGALCVLLLASCSPEKPEYFASGSPQRLSQWQLFELSEEELSPAPASLVFKPANQLFTDYAQKLRTLWLPLGSQAVMHDGEIEYPVGTILSKTFYYPLSEDGFMLQQEPATALTVDLDRNKLIETRLLVRREAGWSAFPYVWNAEQTEAFLRVAGSTEPINLKSDTGNLNFSYFVPNENQCAGCHVTEHPSGRMHPLGAVAKQLSVALDNQSALSQIEHLQERGWLAPTPAPSPTASWLDTSQDIEQRATAYLNIHCGHCHNPEGAADTSALLLDGSQLSAVGLGVCKPPVAAGGGAGDRLYGIVPGQPDRSILLYRMESQAPDEMMPELGRSLVHREGVELIRQWIAAMPGAC